MEPLAEPLGSSAGATSACRGSVARRPWRRTTPGVPPALTVPSVRRHEVDAFPAEQRPHLARPGGPICLLHDAKPKGNPELPAFRLPTNLGSGGTSMPTACTPDSSLTSWLSNFRQGKRLRSCCQKRGNRDRRYYAWLESAFSKRAWMIGEPPLSRVARAPSLVDSSSRTS